MKKRTLFRFNSITHRLLFACVVAAITIYGVSYSQARLIVQKTVGAWMLDSVQSRLKTVVNEIEGKLLAIERSVLLLIQIVQKSETDGNYTHEVLPLLKTLVEQQPRLEAIALIEIPNKTSNIKATGWRYERQVGYTNLNGNETTIWLSQCPIERTNSAVQPFWTQPHPTRNKAGSSSITYCVPLLSKSGSSATIRLLAIEVNLTWLSSFMAKQLTQSDEINYLKEGDPFILSPSNRQWILRPSDPQRVQYWFTQENLTLTDRLESEQFINARTNSQGTLIATKMPSRAWVIGILFRNSKLEQFQQQYLWLLIFSMSKDMVLMCVVIFIISQLTTSPLRALIASTEEMADGNLDTALPSVTSVDEVGRLTQSFQRMQTSLQNYIRDLEETTAAKQKLESEITLAGEIQRTMVPRINVVSLPNSRYDVSALLKPARMVGGDLYDFFLLGGDRLCLIIGDVAGKGFPAALLMARTVTLIRTLTKTLSTPIDILSNVNRELCVDNDECQFVTLFCGVLHLDSGRFCYASAGHDPPLLLQQHQVQYLDLETGSPLGLYEDATFEQSECVLESNDLILLYTDGITEAMNLEGELFSEERLIEIMTSYVPKNPACTIRTIQHFCHQFVGDAPQSDDITLLVLQYLPLGPFSEVANIMEWRLTLNNDLIELEKVKQSLGKILQAQSLSVESIEDTQLIVEELLVNIIQYGYDNQNDSYIPIDLRLELNEHRLTMTFEDGGKPFNPLTEIVPPDLTIDDDQRSQGGFGFFLVQELVEHIDYVYRNNKNILTVCQIIGKLN